ncbi:MAG TPA: Rieske (2Fe-2S) protein [Propionibacteriaceae bacterium]|jgi:Rieske Fe-S protein|nr:Rieske (2Fe-2S) protein [Propionibacteriaceae bacterium]
MSDRPAAPSTPPTATTRRSVLRAAGLAALTGGGVAVLGACTAEGGTGTPAGSSAPASSASSAPASSSAPVESPSASPSTSAPASSPAVPSGPAAATAKVPVGGGVILDDADYVITQPSRGEFKAFSKICTHQNCPVTEIADGSITCKCHGSRFSIEDGSVQTGPATRPLPEAEITVAGNQVVVTG